MKWVTASFIFVVVMSFCFTLFIIFNWILYDPDAGIDPTLDEFAQKHFNRYYRNWWSGITNNIAFGFGLSGVICLGLAIVCYIASVFDSRPRVDAY